MSLSEAEELELLELERERAFSGLNSNVSAAEQKPGLLKQGWDALAVPGKMSREGLGKLAEMVPGAEPTGNAFRDIALNTPKILAETVAETAPGFISRGSMLTAGALKGLQYAAPAAKAIGSGIGRQLEESSGLAYKAPGALGKAWNDSAQIFAKGKKAASPLYEAAKAEVPSGASIFSGKYDPKEILDIAEEFTNKGGKIEPSEALRVRKMVAKLIKSNRYDNDELFALSKKYDALAKADANIAMADPIHARGVTGEALRNWLPQNKTGGASVARTFMAGMAGKAAAPFVSPIVQGMGATAGGLASRYGVEPLVNNPAIGPVLATGLSKYLERK